MRKDPKLSFIAQYGEQAFRAAIRKSQHDLAISGLTLTDDECEHIIHLAAQVETEEQVVELIKQWSLRDAPTET